MSEFVTFQAYRGSSLNSLHSKLADDLIVAGITSVPALLQAFDVLVDHEEDLWASACFLAARRIAAVSGPSISKIDKKRDILLNADIDSHALLAAANHLAGRGGDWVPACRAAARRIVRNEKRDNLLRAEFTEAEIQRATFAGVVSASALARIAWEKQH